jgi:hypothetical protein
MARQDLHRTTHQRPLSATQVQQLRHITIAIRLGHAVMRRVTVNGLDLPEPFVFVGYGEFDGGGCGVGRGTQPPRCVRHNNPIRQVVCDIIRR